MPFSAHVSPVAIVLAGGLGSRIGGNKALAPLGERPLIAYTLDAARAAGLEPVIVAKVDTPLSSLAERVLHEPDAPRHPLCGVVAGLEQFEAVLAIPCDMPLLTPMLLSRLAAVAAAAATPVVNGRLQPFPALYRAECLPILREALTAQAPVRATLARLAPVAIELVDDAQLFSVNTPEELVAAAKLLRVDPLRDRE